MIFHNEVGQESPGEFTGPNRVTAFAWGLEGEVLPDMIICHYPGRREHARWVRNNSCPPQFSRPLRSPGEHKLDLFGQIAHAIKHEHVIWNWVPNAGAKAQSQRRTAH